MKKRIKYILLHIKKYKLYYIIGAVIFLLLPIIPVNSPPENTLPPSVNKNDTVSSIKPQRIEGQIIVKFKKGVTDTQINEHLALYGATIVDRIPAIDRIVIKVPQDQTDIILERLSYDSLIESFDPDYIMHPQATANDPQYKIQYYLKNTGQPIYKVPGTPGVDINIEAAWDVTKGKGVKVAVIDTGLDLDHEDLTNKIVAQKSFISGVTSVNDDHGHGTHVAGIIAANTNNGKGIAGICPDCKLIIAKALDVNHVYSADSIVANAITWTADQGARVINLSLGSDNKTQTMQDAVTYAVNKGAIVVGIAGNCGYTDFAAQFCKSQNPLFYPGAYNGVVTVGATDQKDEKYIKTGTGTWVDIVAPGWGMMSTMPNHTVTMNTNNDKLALNYDTYSGTSMAAPVVSGVLALVLSTGVSRDAAIQRIYSTAKPITGTGSLWMNGRVDAAKAVGAANPTATVPAPTFTCLGSCPTPGVTSQPGPSDQPDEEPIDPTDQPGTDPTDTLPNPSDIISPIPPSDQPPTPSGVNNTSILQLFLSLIIALLTILFGRG